MRGLLKSLAHTEQFLQLVGTDICRHSMVRFGLTKLRKQLIIHALGKDDYRLRFDNEAHMLSKEYNAFIVEVKREMCYNPTQLEKHT